MLDYMWTYNSALLHAGLHVHVHWIYIPVIDNSVHVHAGLHVQVHWTDNSAIPHAGLHIHVHWTYIIDNSVHVHVHAGLHVQVHWTYIMYNIPIHISWSSAMEELPALHQDCRNITHTLSLFWGNINCTYPLFSVV